MQLSTGFSTKKKLESKSFFLSFEYAEYQFAVLNAGRMDDFEGIQTLAKYQLLKVRLSFDLLS